MLDVNEVEVFVQRHQKASDAIRLECRACGPRTGGSRTVGLAVTSSNANRRRKVGSI